MKNLKLFMLAVAASAVIASCIAVTASATMLSDANGMALGAGVSIGAESEGKVALDAPIGKLECESKISGKTKNSGSATETVVVTLESFTYTSCNGETVVLRAGELIVHTNETNANNNGTLTWTGTEVTTTFNGFHCIFETNETEVGILTGSANTKSNATLDINARIPRTGGRSGAFCGSTAPWTGSYKFTAPSSLTVDGTTPVELKGEVPTGNVGETLPVTWSNTGGSSALINDETNSDGTVAETLGSGCGAIAQTGTCSSRKVKCLSKGEATLTIRNTPSVTGSVVLKCDEPELAGGPPTATVGETVTVTWTNNTSGTLVIEDETDSDVTVAETLGSSCGTIASKGSCTSRKIKCLKKGEATITAADTPSVEGNFVIKCS